MYALTRFHVSYSMHNALRQYEQGADTPCEYSEMQTYWGSTVPQIFLSAARTGIFWRVKCVTMNSVTKCLHGNRIHRHKIICKTEVYSLTPSSKCTRPCHLCHLMKFGVDHLVGLLQNSYQVICLLCIARSEECICCARTLWTTCTSNTMDIIFRTLRVVKVDDELHILNIWIK